jgi:hypothetical protein
VTKTIKERNLRSFVINNFAPSNFYATWSGFAHDNNNNNPDDNNKKKTKETRTIKGLAFFGKSAGSYFIIF